MHAFLEISITMVCSSTNSVVKIQHACKILHMCSRTGHLFKVSIQRINGAESLNKCCLHRKILPASGTEPETIRCIELSSQVPKLLCYSAP